MSKVVGRSPVNLWGAALAMGILVVGSLVFNVALNGVEPLRVACLAVSVLGIVLVLRAARLVPGDARDERLGALGNELVLILAGVALWVLGFVLASSV